MAFALKLTHDEPRLIYLALTYHLARPGSELDPETKMPAERGLRDVRRALAPQLGEESAVIELDEEQFRKLLSALFGSVNELRVYHMRAGAASTVARFNETARELFPQVAEDSQEALAVAESMMMLHRRMERAVARAAAEPVATAEETRERRRTWPFRRRR